MKAVSVLLVLASTVGAFRLSDANKDGAIAKVVKMLQDMLKESKDDWKADKAAFDKFNSYCEENTDKKTKAISDGTTTISLLSNKIAEIQGSNGVLSVKTSDLKTSMAENKQAQGDAESLRGKENKAFVGEETDLKAAIGQMSEAITTLSAIGADQTSAKSADHDKFMGNYKEKSLLGIKATVKQALLAASSFLAPEKKKILAAFAQGPFTGTYSAQSGQIVGILKDMKDTFASNLESAQATEKASKAAYDKFMKNKVAEHASLEKSYDEKQASMGTNDGDLSTKKTQLQESTKQKGEDEDFLGKLSKQCKDKTDEYQKRKIFAANEEVALSKAVAILDNDVANEDFGAVKATKLIQLSNSPNMRLAAAQLLQSADKEQHSSRIGQVLLLLEAGNPFTVVLEQISRMIRMADSEQKVDDEEKSWCTATNKKNDGNLVDKTDALETVQADITKLKNDINDPASGLKFQISEAQTGLKTNLKNQKDQTDTRRDDNLEYQKDVSVMSDVVNTLDKAAKSIKDYYDNLDNEQIGLIQSHHSEDPAPPATFTGKYKGQNENAKTVLGLLADIQKNTRAEQDVEHDTELKGQHDYEDSMEALTKAESDYQESIIKLNKDLAGAEKDLEAAYESETATEREKIAIERYIAKMKPGCDFVLNQFDARKTSRAAEKKALEGAETKLKASPSFKSATQKAKEDAFGKCKATCLKDEAHVNCKACLGGTSVPGYCAGHKGAKGC